MVKKDNKSKLNIQIKFRRTLFLWNIFKDKEKIKTVYPIAVIWITGNDRKKGIVKTPNEEAKIREFKLDLKLFVKWNKEEYKKPNIDNNISL